MKNLDTCKDQYAQQIVDNMVIDNLIEIVTDAEWAVKDMKLTDLIEVMQKSIKDQLDDFPNSYFINRMKDKNFAASTKAVIKVEGINYVQLYKHQNGYPEATQQWLEDFNQKITKNRGHVPYYKIAQLVRSSVKDSEEYNLGNSETIGWALIPFGDDAGQKYEYILKTDGSVTVTKV